MPTIRLIYPSPGPPILEEVDLTTGTPQEIVYRQHAAEILTLIEQIIRGYLIHTAVLQAASQPNAHELVPEGDETKPPFTKSRMMVIPSKDGFETAAPTLPYLNMLQTDTSFVATYERVWLAGSILALGDALSQKEYLNNAPMLELIRHLRNGIAHGNKFYIAKGKGGKYLTDIYPAYVKRTWEDSNERSFEITPKLNGKEVLFGFIGPGDIIELLGIIARILYSVVKGVIPLEYLKQETSVRSYETAACKKAQEATKTSDLTAGTGMEALIRPAD